MADPTGEADSWALRLDFANPEIYEFLEADRRLMLQFRGSVITSDGGLLAYRELDDVLALTTIGGERLADARTGKNRQYLLVGLLRQSVFGRLAGYEDVNDAERLCRDPAMRWVVGGRAPMGKAASASEMGRFEIGWLTGPKNLAALADLPGRWIDSVHKRRQPRIIVLDMDSSESPTYGAQEGSAYNGHFGCTCYHPLFVFNQLGDLERCALRPGNVHSADGWRAAGRSRAKSAPTRDRRVLTFRGMRFCGLTSFRNGRDGLIALVDGPVYAVYAYKRYDVSGIIPETVGVA